MNTENKPKGNHKELLPQTKNDTGGLLTGAWKTVSWCGKRTLPRFTKPNAKLSEPLLEKRENFMRHHPIGAGQSSFGLIDADMFFKAIHFEPDMTVLDLGCGAGHYTMAMARHLKGQSRIVAVDLWEEGIARLAQDADSVPGISIEPHIADIRHKLPVASTSVDICLVATVLHDIVHEGDPMPMLKEVARVLKPNGLLAVAEFKKQYGKAGPSKATRLRLEEVSALMLRIGFLRFSAVVDLGPQVYFAKFKKL